MFTKLTDDHFMMYVSQIIILYTLTLYRTMYQLYQYKWKKKKII